MKKSYKQLFLDSLKATNFYFPNPINGCLDSSEFILTNDIKDQISNLLNEKFNSSDDLEKFLGFGCVYVNSSLAPLIEDIIDNYVYFTVGYVEFLGENVFHTPFDELIKLTKTDKKEHSHNVHVWLTLPSFEIIDLTFYHSMFHVNDDYAKKYLDKIYFGINEYISPEKPRYIPQLVGFKSIQSISHYIYQEETGDKNKDFEMVLENIKSAIKK